MAIANTVLRQTVMGDDRVIYGKSVLSGAASTGAVVTGLSQVEFFNVINKDATPSYTAVTDDFPIASGSVNIKASGNDKTIYWQAFGR